MGTKDVCARCLRGQHDQCTVGQSCGCQTCNPPLVVWEEPPARFQRKQDPIISSAQQAEMRAHPGKWARVREYKTKGSASTYANAVRKGKIATLPPGDWEFTGRSDGKGGSILYARFVGKPVRAVAEGAG